MRLQEVFLTDDYLVLAMEYAAGGDLFKLVSSRRGLPEDDARWLFQQIMFAIDYCHRMVSALAGPGSSSWLLPPRDGGLSARTRQSGG